MDNNQETFLKRIRRALGKTAPAAANITPGSAAVEPLQAAETYPLPSPDKLLEMLRHEAEALRVQLTVCPDEAAAGEAIAQLIKARQEPGRGNEIAIWDHPLLAALKLPERLAGDEIIFHQLSTAPTAAPGAAERRAAIKSIAASFMGITSADYCLAATASLVLRSRPGQDQLIALLPAIYVAVINSDQLLADLEHFYAVLRGEAEIAAADINGCLTLISGPSKTGDIEAAMVNGVHGPEELHLLIIKQD